MDYKKIFFNISSVIFFSICYLVIVPFFAVMLWIMGILNSKARRQNTAWKACASQIDPDFFRRMG